MATERNAEPKGENEVEGHATRWGANPEDQPGEGEADTEGHRFKYRGVPEDIQDTDAEPEVEGQVHRFRFR
jgi:hypothetical protein